MYRSGGMRGRLVGRIAMVVLLASLIGGISPAQASDDPNAVNDSTVIAESKSPVTEVKTDGRFVGWSVFKTSRDSDLYAVNLQGDVVIPVATGPSSQECLDMDGGIAVWTDTNYEGVPSGETPPTVIFMKNLTTGQVSAVAADVSSQCPAIAGKWVAYWGSDGSLWMRNITTMAEPVQVAKPQSYGTGLAMSGDWVLWSDLAGIENSTLPPPQQWRLMAQQIGSSEPKVLEEGWGYPPDATISEDLALYAPLAPSADQVKIREDHLIVADLRTGETQTIQVPPDCSATPTPTDGHYAVGSCTADAASLLWGLDLKTESTFPITIADADISHASNYSYAGGTLAWTEQQPSGWSVHAAPIAGFLPSARRPDPGTTSPNWLYFAATGHYLSAGFQQFWSQSGGVPVFGFPLTEEFTEQGLTVQYLERQRFEYHPEFALTPYETELGLLGSEDANRRGLLSSAAFQPSTGTSDANCTFVAETSHTLCGMFRSYWQEHGLEFTDSGISYRESLALFGYPISEAYTDPATGLETQYFERARFEYHPENPVANQVLLGRLGADVMAERGW